MPISVNLRGHSAQFTIEWTAQTPAQRCHTHLPTHTHPLKHRFSSWNMQSGATRRAQQSEMGTGPETLEHVSAFHHVSLSVCPSHTPCLPPLSPCCCCFLCTYWASSDSMFLTFTNATCFSNFQMRSRVDFKCLQCLPTGAWQQERSYIGLAI